MTRPRRRRQQTAGERVVIVGGGRAGVAAASELRRGEFAGEIVLLSAETDPPYHRPSCSKGLLTGQQRPRDVRLSLEDCTNVDWRLGRRVLDLDPVNRVVGTDTDEEFAYDGLVIATGSYAVAPRGWPVGQPGLHLLHSVSDAWALRRDLRDADRVAIVGAGLTGCETAYAVMSMARDCVIIDSNQAVMTRALGDVAAEYVTDVIRHDHVDLRLTRRVQQIARHRRGWRLVLDDGSEVCADVVVATTGERPDIGWLSSARSLDLSDGVLCDQYLRVVGADGIVAAGAAARWPNLRYSAEPTRCGQWIAAMETGRAAARTLLAGRGPIDPVTPLTRYWTEQFGLRIQVSGELARDADIYVTEMRPGRRRDTAARGGVLISYIRDEQLIGLVGVNAPQAFTAVTRSLLVSARPVPMTAAGRPQLAAVS